LLETCAFRYEKTTDFDCHRVENQFRPGRAGMHR
jgi:hypothetical protein